MRVGQKEVFCFLAESVNIIKADSVEKERMKIEVRRRTTNGSVLGDKLQVSLVSTDGGLSMGKQTSGILRR